MGTGGMDEFLGTIIAWAGGFLLLAVIFLLIPFLIAVIRGHRYKWVILVLCVLGLFGLPWIAAFIWSVWPRQSSLVEPILGNPTGTGTRNVGDTWGGVEVGRSRGRAQEQLEWRRGEEVEENSFESREWTFSGFDQSGKPIRFVFDVVKRQGERILIGRDSRDCEFLITDPSVSRRHAEILIRVEGVFIRDLNSSNGTRLNGERLAGVPIAMPPTGSITVGAVLLQFY